MYLAGADAKHPYASPLYGDPRGPAAGADPGRVAMKSCATTPSAWPSGCATPASAAELEIWPRMPHVWHLFARILPEARQAIERIGAFVRNLHGTR